VTPCPGERCDDVPYTDGAPLSFGQDIRNTGPMPVTILGFPGVDDGIVVIDSVEVARDGDAPNTDPSATEPFDTLTIQPGQTRFLVFRGSFAPCDEVDGEQMAEGELLRSVPLRVRMLLLEHTGDVELGRPLRFGPADEACA
jgi:hypothetical protein